MIRRRARSDRKRCVTLVLQSNPLKRLTGLGFCAVAVSFAAPANAQSDEDLFVEANLLSIFYHELGHAAIDLLQLPVFGQEEDAADVASILLIDALYESETALDLAYDAASGFAAEAIAREEGGYDVAWWSEHGPDEQRFYNSVCLFYGADPEGREEFAEDMGLPEERAETCDYEYELAADSWGPVFDDLAGDGYPMVFSGQGDSLTTDLIAAEVEALNEDFAWPVSLTAVVEPCGEANAFYDPSGPEVIICTEFEPHLRMLFGLLD